MTAAKSTARVLVLAECAHRKLTQTTTRLITAAQKFGLPVDLLVAGIDCREAARQATLYEGLSRILLAEPGEILSLQADDLTACILPLLRKSHDILLAAANTAGRELIPRLAAKIDVSPLTDVIQILDPERFVRPIHAGEALIEVKMRDQKKLMTVHSAGFKPIAVRPENTKPAELVICPPFPLANLSRLIGVEAQWDQSTLEDAKTVIGLGRGAAITENLALIENLATHLGAVIGGTKEAVDRGMVPRNLLIGQSGQTIAPKLYIALGISGAVQHLAGIRDAQVIIAINKDPDAPIFKVADYGLVGDLREVLPELEKALAL